MFNTEKDLDYLKKLVNDPTKNVYINGEKSTFFDIDYFINNLYLGKDQLRRILIFDKAIKLYGV